MVHKGGARNGILGRTVVRPANFLASASRAVALLALALVAPGCRRAHAVAARPAVVTPAPVSPAPAAPPAPPDRGAAWTVSAPMRHAAFPGVGLPAVVVHAPAGFDPALPLHIVVFAHGWGSYALQWLANGAARVFPDAPAMPGWALGARHDAARTRTLLVAPEFDTSRNPNWAGRFEHRGFFRDFLAELLGETLAARLGGPRSVDDIASITLVGQSAGGIAVHSMLESGLVAERVRAVVLLDAFYTGAEVFAAWAAGGTPAAPRRFVSVHTPGGTTERNGLALLARVPPGSAVLDPGGPLADAVRTHRVVVARTGMHHLWLALLLYAKVLEGLDLPRQVTLEDPKHAVLGVAAQAVPLRLGAPVDGALERGDLPLRDGSYGDDYTVDLAAGVPVVIHARGGASLTEVRAPLDVYLEVRRGEVPVVADDDGGGGFASRVLFTPRLAGAYTVRVTSAGPLVRMGPYTLDARVAPPPPRRRGSRGSAVLAGLP